MKYFKGLDTLRFIAVTFVIISHSFPNNPTFRQFISFGFIGVSFFFVLSGFLITTILLEEKESANSLIANLKTFYIRRSLRIFPAYYLLLVITYFLKNEYLLNYPWYFITYTQNFLFYVKATYADSLSPTWTLAVEEQFYLIWPVLILAFEKTKVKKIIIGLIFFSPIFRVLITVISKMLNHSSGLNLALMPSNLICLSGGGLLAYFFHYKDIQKVSFLKNKYVVIVLIICYSLFYFITKYMLTKPNFWTSIFEQVLILALSSSIILQIVIAQKKTFILNNPITVYLGKISYGLYLYHTVAIAIVLKLGAPSFIINTNNDWIDFIVHYVIIIGIATISWFLIEKPLNKLKRYFKYDRGKLLVQKTY